MIGEPEIAAAAMALCKSGKFETGQGSCALICLDVLGPARRGCQHRLDVHRKMATAILEAAAKVRSP